MVTNTDDLVLVWFKQSKNVDFISVNTKTGDVYVGGISNYHLKTKSKEKDKT